MKVKIMKSHFDQKMRFIFIMTSQDFAVTGQYFIMNI